MVVRPSGSLTICTPLTGVAELVAMENEEIGFRLLSVRMNLT